MPLARFTLCPFAAILFGTLAYSVEADGKHAQSAVASGAERRTAMPPLAGQQYWRLFQSANFTICCPRWFDGETALHRCESLRQKLSRKWLATEAEDWASRCYVVLHSSATTYVHTAGRGSEQTSGCSTVKQWNGRVSRRIDLRLDRPEPLNNALPHELTHIVLADIVVHNKLPRWADEGMAMLADSDEKRLRHGRDFQSALIEGRTFRLAELLAMNDYPPPDKQREFYSQSLGLVAFLVERQTPQRFLQFAKAGAAKGYDAALREHYGLQDVRELERAWLAASRPKLNALKVASLWSRAKKRTEADIIPLGFE